MHPIALTLAAVICLGGHYAGPRAVVASHGNSHGILVEEPESDSVSLALQDRPLSPAMRLARPAQG